jgi:hypothetical protein
VPLFIFIPVVGYYSYLSFVEKQLGIWEFAASFIVGVIIWTLMEYLIHRFIFHGHPNAEWAKKKFTILFMGYITIIRKIPCD